MLYEAIGIIAGILGLAGYIPYIKSILDGKTRPNRASWFIWSLVGGLLTLTYIAEGDPHSIWLPIGYFLGAIITALLSLRYGYLGWSRLDTICIIAAVLSVIPWILTDNPSLTLIINVLIDIAGAIPTLLKTYREPETEEFGSWFLFWLGSVLQFFAIQIWNIATLYPIYLFLLASLMMIFLLRKGLKSGHKKV